MTNSDILRRVRFIFDLNDFKMIKLFGLADYEVERIDVSAWLKKEDDPEAVEISDRELALFLNGFIIDKRGKRDGPQVAPEDPLSNNMILRKLKIALELRTDEILDLYASIDKPISKNELSAFFRNPEHKSYQKCMDQYLRNFLAALQKKFRK